MFTDSNSFQSQGRLLPSLLESLAVSDLSQSHGYLPSSTVPCVVSQVVPVLSVLCPQLYQDSEHIVLGTSLKKFLVVLLFCETSKIPIAKLFDWNKMHLITRFMYFLIMYFVIMLYVLSVKLLNFQFILYFARTFLWPRIGSKA